MLLYAANVTSVSDSSEAVLFILHRWQEVVVMPSDFDALTSRVLRQLRCARSARTCQAIVSGLHSLHTYMHVAARSLMLNCQMTSDFDLSTIHELENCNDT